MRIALDAMGGDHAPGSVVQGAVEALKLFEDVEVVLVGDQQRIESELPGGACPDRFQIVHTTQVIEMGEHPLDSLRQKKDSSIARLVQMGARGDVDAIISAGNTGAYAAGCQLRMRTLPGIARAGTAVTIPAFYGPFVLCDVGANIEPKHHHLYQYAIMGQLFAKHVVGLERQRVGLLSVGEENAKGTGIIKQANELLSNDPDIEFVGNIEGRDLFEGVCDVAVCDGFVGNIILKLFEGLSRGIFETVAKEIVQEDPSLKAPFDAVVRKVWKKHDYTEYGGAPLLGVRGVAMLCHGSSDARAIRSTIRSARDFVAHKLNDLLTDRFSAVGTASS